MEAEGGEFQDWELLHHNSDTESALVVNSSESKESTDFVDDSEGMIQTNYFSLDSEKKYVTTDVSEVCSDNSDNPSWIDPRLETRYPRKNSAEFWSDSGSERSDDKKFNEFEGKNEMGFVQDVQNENIQQGFDEDEQIMVGNEKGSKEIWSPSGGAGSEDITVGDIKGNSELGLRENEVLGEEKSKSEACGGGNKDIIEVGKVKETKKNVVWWKLPVEFLRYCVFRASPVWTVSVAAAVMGLLILGRRLYKMKKKSRTLELKVTMDDKKISQFMSRAARLNEAFSVVKRVPVIRPSLPAVGVTPWPVVSMR